MTQEIALLLMVLAVAVVLLASGRLRPDVVAMCVMVSLPWLGLIEPDEAFRGFSSGAVLAIIGVVIMGHGLEVAGVTRHLARPLLRLAGNGRRRLLAVLLATVSGVSGFVQNAGAAALFLPVGLRMSRARSIPVSRVVMPLGFAAILGGTLSMVGSSPLIVLNDLLDANDMERFPLFAPLPIGAVLVAAGIVIFALFGGALLPRRRTQHDVGPDAEELLSSWSLVENVEEVMIPEGSALVGRTRKEVGLIPHYEVHVLAIRQLGQTSHAPRADTVYQAGMRLALFGEPENCARVIEDYGLRRRSDRGRPLDLLGSETSGYAEVLVAPRAAVLGRSLRELGFRRTYGVEPLVLNRAGEHFARVVVREPLQIGDMLLVHGPWRNIRRLGLDSSFVVLTPLDSVAHERSKPLRALACFLLAIGLALYGASMPLAFFSGALGMILLGVLRPDEAYRAVSWRTVFLLAGLIPLGVAMQSTGAAAYLAEGLSGLLAGRHEMVVVATLAAVTSLLTLVLSSVATCVVLAPLAIDLARIVALDPHELALVVGLCAQNSFLLPTHQVNALLQEPGGYRAKDYLRAGGILTVVFLLVVVLGVPWLYQISG